MPADRNTPPTRLAIRGDLLDLVAEPAWGEVDSKAVRYDPDSWLLVENGRITGRQQATPDASWTLRDHRGSLVLPGFVDTHVHSPQIDMIASYGTELLDWLNTYTFPAERRYADADEARAGGERFVEALLAYGTTTSVVFPTVHKTSVDGLFEAARARGMRMIAGKVLMDRHAPDGLRDDVAQAERDCVDLIERWHGTDRLAYAVTPRFAPTSTPEQLAMAGALCKAWPSVYMQTHVAENRDEVQWVRELFPEARSYLDVYVRAGLMNSRSVLAHGIWLNDADRAAMRECGAQIAHSPSSNLFLGSGLFDWRSAEDAGVKVSLASDVGGGTSLSMIRTMADAYKVQALGGWKLTAWKALYAATRGGAAHLGLDEEVGSLEAGRVADLCVWDWARGPVARRRMQMVQTGLHERLFAWMTLADENNLDTVYVAGVEQFDRRTGGLP